MQYFPMTPARSRVQMLPHRLAAAAVLVLFLLTTVATASAQEDASTQTTIGSVDLAPQDAAPGDEVTITISVNVSSTGESEHEATPPPGPGTWSVANQLPAGLTLEDASCDAKSDETSCDVQQDAATGSVVVTGALKSGIDEADVTIVITATVDEDATPESTLTNITCSGIAAPATPEAASGTPEATAGA
jgi:hypothetical protein